VTTRSQRFDDGGKTAARGFPTILLEAPMRRTSGVRGRSPCDWVRKGSTPDRLPTRKPDEPKMINRGCTQMNADRKKQQSNSVVLSAFIRVRPRFSILGNLEVEHVISCKTCQKIIRCPRRDKAAREDVDMPYSIVSGSPGRQRISCVISPLASAWTSMGN